jgi:ABC-2 type transport system ATP-binding protein
MLKVLTNLTRPTSGYASINGIRVYDNPRKALMRVGSLVEQPEFYPYLKGREILDFVCKIRGIGRGDIGREISRVSELTGITEYLDARAGGYSRGMKQRLGLAGSMVSDPDILILDEPTFGLDPRGMKEMRDVIREFASRKERLVIMSTHLVSEAKELSDRVIIVNHGNVIKDQKYRSEDMIVKVTLETGIDGSNGMDSIDILENHGNMIIARKKEGQTNDDLIRSLNGMGYRIRFVEPYNDIEEIYMKNVS